MTNKRSKTMKKQKFFWVSEKMVFVDKLSTKELLLVCKLFSSKEFISFNNTRVEQLLNISESYRKKIKSKLVRFNILETELHYFKLTSEFKTNLTDFLSNGSKSIKNFEQLNSKSGVEATTCQKSNQKPQKKNEEKVTSSNQMS